MLRSSIRTLVRSHALVGEHKFGQRQISGKPNEFLQISEEIKYAVGSGQPVVALETTIYTHGFPYPANAALALHLESVVRKNGAIPATIGVLNGIARVGFMPKELTELAMSAGRADTMKLSRRDLGYICGLGLTNQRLNGGTTIAGTMILAHLAGIGIFATGGLGGVHRGGENSMDISADLTELGRTPVTVVSSGCKSFLDIPRTLEYLETEGVLVGTFADGRDGRVDFPAFWTRNSGIPSPAVIKDEKQAAAIVYAQRALPIKSGIFLANPIPVEYSLEKTYMDGIIAQALHDARESGSSGSDNTPFVLKRIRELTGGSTVTANSALVEANVLRGTRLAVELARLECQEGHMPRNHDRSASVSKKTTATIETPLVSVVSSRPSSRVRYTLSNNSTDAPRGSVVAKPLSDVASQQILVDNSFRPLTATASKGLPTKQESDTSTITSQTSQALSLPNDTEIIVAGSLAIDLSCDYAPEGSYGPSVPQRSTSNPAAITQSLGGVGQNVATTIHYCGSSVRLCTFVGNDPAGLLAKDKLEERGLQTSGIIKKDGCSTAQYVAVNDSRKDLVLAMADMTILECPLSPNNNKTRVQEFRSQWQVHLSAPKLKWIVVDANWDQHSIRMWTKAGRLKGAQIAFEPVSAVKSTRLFGRRKPYWGRPPFIVDLATPNLIELGSMHAAAKSMDWFKSGWNNILDAMGIPKGSLVEGGTLHQAIELLPYIPTILTKLGDQGVLMTQLLHPSDDRLTSKGSAPYILHRSDGKNALAGGVYVRLFPPVEKIPKNKIISVNGVGDTFLGILMAGLAKEHPKNLEDLIDIAQRGSVMTLKSKESVSPQVSTLGSEL